MERLKVRTCNFFLRDIFQNAKTWTEYVVFFFEKISTLNIFCFQESLNLNIVESDIAALSEDQVAKIN